MTTTYDAAYFEWFPADDRGPLDHHAWMTYHAGFEASVNLNPEGEWWWMVRPTGERSETPELYDAGSNRTAHAAKVAAEKAVRQADKEYQHINYG